MTNELWWYSIRASGLLAWAVLAASVVVGLLMSTGLAPVKKSRRLHSWLAGTGVAMVALHLLTLLGDGYMSFDLTSILVPFAASWRTGAVAWGVATVYLIAAVELTSLVRRWMPVKWWRGVHLASFLAFWTATMHAVTAGTDIGLPLVGWVVITTVVVVLGLLLLRIAQSVVPGARARLARRRRQGADRRDDPARLRPDPVVLARR